VNWAGLTVVAGLLALATSIGWPGLAVFFALFGWLMWQS
jgi:hypothetical protein